MRRKEREVSDLQEILEFIDSCDVLRIGMIDENGIYIVPVSYGFKYDGGLTFYIHGAKEGRKASIIKNCPSVGFELDGSNSLMGQSDVACTYSSYYKSVIGNGSIRFIEDIREKKEAFALLMKHCTGEDRDWKFNESVLERTSVMELKVSTFSCKKHEQMKTSQH